LLDPLSSFIRGFNHISRQSQIPPRLVRIPNIIPQQLGTDKQASNELIIRIDLGLP